MGYLYADYGNRYTILSYIYAYCVRMFCSDVLMERSKTTFHILLSLEKLHLNFSFGSWVIEFIGMTQIGMIAATNPLLNCFVLLRYLFLPLLIYLKNFLFWTHFKADTKKNNIYLKLALAEKLYIFGTEVESLKKVNPSAAIFYEFAETIRDRMALGKTGNPKEALKTKRYFKNDHKCKEI